MLLKVTVVEVKGATYLLPDAKLQILRTQAKHLILAHTLAAPAVTRKRSSRKVEADGVNNKL